MVRCFAGCEVKAILAALGLSWGDLYLDEEREAYLQKKREAERRVPAIRKGVTRKPLGKLEATYRYTDENGNLVAEKLRYEGKVFLWRKPKIGGGWIWKIDRTILPLYLLHEVAKAQNVILTEGEKDVNNVRAIIHKPGWAVTTAPNGAESWRQDFSKWFIGKKTWILPDTDKPGMKYAYRAAGHIKKVALTVNIVSVAPAKDVSDFLQQNSVEDLHCLFTRGKALTARAGA